MSKLSQECEDVYIKHGQSGVFDYVLKHYPKTPWEWCDPCEIDSPADVDHTCLVCGSPTTKETQ